MTFRINAKNYFLTYAQCTLSKEELAERIQGLEGDRIKWMVVAHEVHQDGGDHLHVQIEYEHARNIRRAEHFDFDGFHPNVQGTRQMKKVAEYVRKDGDYMLVGVSEEEFQEILKGNGKESKYAEVLRSQTYEEACEVVQRVDPRSWVNNGDRIRDNLKWQFQPRFPEYTPIFNEVLPAITPEDCQLWLEEEFTKQSRAKCLFLIGASKLGKTHWARSIVQPHTYWKCMVNLDEWNPEAKLLIFDDFEKWEFVPCPKGYLTQAGQCTVTDKYRKKKTINVNMPAIFLCNDMPCIGTLPLSQDNYWQANGLFVRVFDKMY